MDKTSKDLFKILLSYNELLSQQVVVLAKMITTQRGDTRQFVRHASKLTFNLAGAEYDDARNQLFDDAWNSIDHKGGSDPMKRAIAQIETSLERSEAGIAELRRMIDTVED